MSKIAIELKWALRFTVFTMAWILAERTVGWHQFNYAQYLLANLFFVIPGLALLYLEIKEKRNEYYQGQMTWMQGTMSGLLTTFFCILIIPVTTWNVIHFISPDFISAMKFDAIHNSKMDPEEANLFFGIRGYILDRVQLGLSGGIVGSALMAYLLKSK